MSEILRVLQQIATDPTLSPAQKAHALSVTAERLLPYPALDEATQAALDARIICDMYEGHAPYKPRYVLPDYAVLLQQGSAWLELPPPQTLEEAIHTLMIAYHHVPSVTGMPVFIGHLDQLLLPFCEGVSDEVLYRQIKLFWRYLDRTLPDAFMHANIGPDDNRVARAVLQVDAELQQVAPNLTFLYDPAVSGEAMLRLCTDNIIRCGKPHIANHPLQRQAFDARGYAVVSCYNSLPLGGGASTLTRINLARVARLSRDEDDFFRHQLPRYVDLNARLTRSRVNYLFEQSGFFASSFLVAEGWIDPARFTAMFGVFGMAEAVNQLQDLAGRAGRYGHDATANALGYRISAELARLVAAEPMDHVWRGHAMLHAQAGISSDQDATPALRIPYGSEPDPVTHVLALLPHHAYYLSGISEILTLDETVRANPEAVYQLAQGALASGLREFTANVQHNDLVRVTGYMIRLSDVQRFNEARGSRINTTVLGAEAAASTGILARQPRVVAQEWLAGAER
ncbi:YjjI family glycine radical enzyme [Paludibacterium sp. THUN1379]|uniref:YjjI family glycine radical enzyme n=1 Tax=Paludibacterium sp. THUN1379 TaxID=3112107 RepID=UPI00308E9814|nr:YjjI family glycine radical enzyme [Paludibacterium sp. THUN1379]